MPLTVLTPSGVLDATSCGTDEWAAVHKIRPRAQLICRGCGGPMQAKTIARTGTRFFAHDRAEANCWLNGETGLHRQLKAAIADLVRGCGGSAEVEAVPAEGDVGGWRADVLACAPDGRRIAFEVQLAAMTIAEGHERQRRYAIDRIETIWLTTKQPQWLWSLAGVRLLEASAGAGFVVSAGLAKLIEAGWSCPLEPVALEKVIAGVLAGSIEHYEVDWLSEARSSHPSALVPSVHARRDETRCRAEAAAEARRKSDQERHAQHMERLYARQAYLLPIAVARGDRRPRGPAREARSPADAVPGEFRPWRRSAQRRRERDHGVRVGGVARRSPP